VETSARAARTFSDCATDPSTADQTPNSLPSPRSAARSKFGPISTGATSLPCATSTSVLPRRSSRVSGTTRPAFSTSSIQFTAAEMKMSAGAPSMICLASAFDPA